VATIHQRGFRWKGKGEGSRSQPARRILDRPHLRIPAQTDRMQGWATRKAYHLPSRPLVIHRRARVHGSKVAGRQGHPYHRPKEGLEWFEDRIRGALPCEYTVIQLNPVVLP
jgi:hypothetical protein